MVLPYLQKIHILPVFACYSHSISVPVIPGCSRHSKDSCPTAPWPPQPAPGQPVPGQLTLTAATEASPGSRGCHTGSTPPVPNCPRPAKHALPGTAQHRAPRSTGHRTAPGTAQHRGQEYRLLQGTHWAALPDMQPHGQAMPGCRSAAPQAGVQAQKSAPQGALFKLSRKDLAISP